MNKKHRSDFVCQVDFGVRSLRGVVGPQVAHKYRLVALEGFVIIVSSSLLNTRDVFY